ncbi:outer membrane protein, heavy metal efflux system [uncultured Gammaproteobacteria bacterium]
MASSSTGFLALVLLALWSVEGQAQSASQPSSQAPAHRHSAAHAAAPAKGAPAKGAAIGASVEELLAIVRTMNPELAASALEAEAAAARAEGADALPDPKFQVRFEDIPRTPGGAPRPRINTYKFSVQQDFPLWGKRGLKREVAEAESRQAEGRTAALLAELTLRVKTTYAEYHQIHLASDQTDEVLKVVRTLGQFAQVRYAQGLGLQQDVISAESERAVMSSEKIRLDGDRRRARARLNTLLGRSADGALVETPRPRPIPKSFDYQDLLERAIAANPLLRIEQAKIQAADHTRTLADRSWYPDVGVSLGAVQRGGTIESYEAMLEVNVPLQWGLRQSQQREAAAMAGAARSKLETVRLQVESDLREAVIGLETASGMAKVLQDTAIPQARLAVSSAFKSYETGLGEVTPILDGVQRLKRVFVELLKVQFEQQARLAEIERLIGGEL